MPDTCMAFDVGLKRIGVAVGEPLLGSARPLQAVANRNGTPDWPAIERLIEQWQPKQLVVGLPLTVDGGEQEMTRQARGFMRRLRGRTGLTVEPCDERYSSREAGERIASQRASGLRGSRSSHADVDTEAAAIILERWFARS